MKRWLILLLCITALTYTAGANDIFNNLANPSDGADPINGFGPLYDSFTTLSTPFELDSVTLALYFPGPATGSFTVGLYADNNINPDGLLYTIATVSDSSLALGLNDYTYTLAMPQLLLPNTRYWIGLSSGDSNTYWSWSLSQNGIGLAGNYFANIFGVQSDIDGPYQMRVSSNIPEPGTLALMASGLVGIAGTMRRRFC